MSTTIDNKVVNMSFNNANFESNVRTSINTIDKLKGSLNSLSGNNLNKLNNMDVTPVANSFEQVGSAIDTVRVKFSMLDVAGATVVANLTTSLMGFAQKTLGFVTNAITQGGINRAMKIQNARFQLKGLLHDAAEVEKVMEDVDYGVADTAYGLDAAAQVASQLAASGIRAGDSMKAYLRGISGVAAMTNSSYEEIGQIFTRVAGNGRLMAIDLQSLASRGMNAAATLAEAMGKTEEEIRDMVSKGKISFDDFAKAMDNAFGEHAKDANRTFSGVTANIRSALAKIGADFVTPFVVENSPFIQFLDDIRKKLNEFRKWLKPASELVANSMVNMFGKWRDFLSSFDLAGFLSNYSLVDYLKNIGARFKEMNIDVESLKKTLDGCVAVFEIFAKVTKTLFDVFISIVTSKAMATIINGFLKVTGVVGEVVRALADLITGENITGLFNKILEGVSALVSGIFSIFSGMGSVLSGIKDFVVSLFHSVGEAISGVINWIKETISPLDVLSGILAGGLAGVLLRIIQLLARLKWVVTKSGIFGILFGTGSTGMTAASTTTIGNSIKSVLGSLGTALRSLTTTVKATTLVAIAAAVAMLVNALVKLSNLNVVKLGTGLTALVILMNSLMLSFTKFSKLLTEGVGSGKIISLGIALLLFAQSINVLATAVNKMGELSIGGLAKGLLGLYGAMVILVKAMQSIANIKFSAIQTLNVVFILALANVCKTMAEALSVLSGISWDGIARSLLGLYGAMVILDRVIYSFSNMKGAVKAIPSVISVFILSKTLGDIADALKSIGDLSWESIMKGLIGLYGALGTLTQVLSVFAGFEKLKGSLVGAVSIAIVATSIKPLVDALKDISTLSWEGIMRGLVGLGGALAELVAAIGILKIIGGLSGLIASTSILITAQTLGEIASALSIIGKLSWEEIARGLVGMGVALGELAVTVGLLGTLAPLAALGGLSLYIAVQGLVELAEALTIFSEIPWDKATNGVMAMGEALTVLAVGGLMNSFSIIGAISISKVSESLISLARAVSIFATIPADKIKTSIQALGAALGSVGFGSFINTIGIIGSFSIERVAKPLGDLADSMVKWSAVKVPQSLTKDLAQLASGIASFFGGFGVESFSQVVEPMGILADSMSKWKDVSIPEDIDSSLKRLAVGVESFLFSGMGAEAVSVVGAPLGDLADSVSKWRDVEVPSDLASNLSALAQGIQEFTWTFLSGFSISEVAVPLGDLAESVSKWKDVEIPEGIGDSLETLSNAVARFGSNFISAWSMDSVSKPLGDIADAIAKWKDVQIPEGLSDKLNTFAKDVVNFGSELRSVINNDYSKIGGFAEAIDKLQASVSNISAVDKETITSFIESLTSLSALNLNADTLGSFADGISSAISSIMDTIVNGISSRTDDVRLQGQAVITALNDGFQDYNATIELINQMLNQMIDSINSRQEDFKVAGLNLVLGLKSGIENNSGQAVEAARRMAADIIATTKNTLDEHSPSRVFQKIGEFIPEGMVLGINSLSSVVVNSVKDMATSAVSGTKEAISNLSKVVQNDIDANPTIRPVLDLSNIYSGLEEMKTLFGNDQYRNFAFLNGSPIAGKNITYQLVLDGAVYNDIPEIENVVGNAFEIMGRYRGMNYG